MSRARETAMTQLKKKKAPTIRRLKFLQSLLARVRILMRPAARRECRLVHRGRGESEGGRVGTEINGLTETTQAISRY